MGGVITGSWNMLFTTWKAKYNWTEMSVRWNKLYCWLDVNQNYWGGGITWQCFIWILYPSWYYIPWWYYSWRKLMPGTKTDSKDDPNHLDTRRKSLVFYLALPQINNVTRSFKTLVPHKTALLGQDPVA